MFGKAKRGATQRPATKERTQGKLIPSWLWMAFGVLLGLCCAVLLYLWQPWQPANRPIDATQPTEAAAKDDKAGQTNKDYQFYDLLPKQQITPVPDQAVPSNSTKVSNNSNGQIIVAPTPQSSKAGGNASADQNATHSDPAEISNSSAPAAPQFILQVNSYKNPDDADARRAQILLVGLPADVRQSTANDGSNWFRVVSGPYSSKVEALNAQHLLQDSGIDSLVVEQR